MNKRQRKKYVTTYIRIRNSIEKNPDPRYVLDAYLRPYRIGKRKAAIVRSMIYCLAIDKRYVSPKFQIFLEWNPYECGDWITKLKKNSLSLHIRPWESNNNYHIYRKTPSKYFGPSLNELIDSAIDRPVWVANNLAWFYGIEDP